MNINAAINEKNAIGVDGHRKINYQKQREKSQNSVNT